MNVVLLRLRARLAPALVVTLGVFLLGSGLLAFTRASEPAPVSYAVPTHLPLPTLSLQTIDPNLQLPSFQPDRTVTRVAVKRLGIDLPVMLQDKAYGDFPLCDVAMFLPSFGRPGQGRATYIYAHARIGMFRPLLAQSRIENGAAMLGMTVEVWTSDDWLFIYKITEVRRHILDLTDAMNTTTERVFLQTSEGPNGTIPKLQVVGDFVSAQPATEEEAHPQPHPRLCG